MWGTDPFQIPIPNCTQFSGLYRTKHLTKIKSRVYFKTGNTGNLRKMKRIRNKDIAEIVGVSRAAVTQVLNGSRPGCVSPEKRDSILRIAKENNYYPDFAAQVLGSGRTRTIGMPMPWMQTLATSFSCGRLLNHVTTLLEKRGYMLTLLPVANDSSSKIHQDIDALLCSRRVDGLIINQPFLNPEAEQTIRRNRIPAVSFGFSSDSRHSSPGIPNVMFDCRAALDELITRFSQYGKTAMIALLKSSNTRVSIFKSRPELTLFGLEQDPYFLYNTAAAAMVFIRAHWQELKNYPCWILQNDSFAYAAVCVIREMGLVPGKDILLAGFDDVEENFEAPFFTTVHDPFDEMADECIRLLFDQLISKKFSEERVTVRSRVVYRGSSLPVNPAN